TRKARHARLVTENGSASPCRGRINSKYGNLVTFARQMRAEQIDRGRFARARRTRDAETYALAGERQQFLHEVVRDPAVIRPLALDQRDRTCQHRAVAGADATNKIDRERVARSHRFLKPPEMIALARGFCNAIREAKYEASLTPFPLGCGACEGIELI